MKPIVLAAVLGRRLVRPRRLRQGRLQGLSEGRVDEATADARAKIEAQGYTIDKFKVAGNCYEIYGKNKEGKKVEIYYDAKTLEPVKSEIEK